NKIILLIGLIFILCRHLLNKKYVKTYREKPFSPTGKKPGILFSEIAMNPIYSITMGSWFSGEWQKLDEINSSVAKQKEQGQSSSSSIKTVTKQNAIEKLKIETPIIDRTRVLDDDPRSPTFGINRTPIEIEKTPRPTKSLLYSNVVAATTGDLGCGKKSQKNSDDLQKISLKANFNVPDGMMSYRFSFSATRNLLIVIVVEQIIPHHLRKFFVIDLAVTGDVNFAENFVDFIFGEAPNFAENRFEFDFGYYTVSILTYKIRTSELNEIYWKFTIIAVDYRLGKTVKLINLD
uniref:Uncharacterized protein n=1 Tax=Romanomermis culicivorax TaxID=13658 RepID=A0A915K2P1_ROMCU